MGFRRGDGGTLGMQREALTRPWDAQALAEIGAGPGQACQAIKEEKSGCFMGFSGCLCFSFL